MLAMMWSIWKDRSANRRGRRLLACGARLRKQRQELELADHADTKRSITEEARLLRQDAARLRNKPEFVRASVRSQIDELLEFISVHVGNEIDNSIRERVHRLAGHARNALLRGGKEAVDDARRSLAELRSVPFAALAKQPGFWIARLAHLGETRHLAVDKALHDRLMKEATDAQRANDIDTVRNLTIRIHENMMTISAPGQANALAGLMR